MVVSAFALQCSEAKSWHDGINKARQIYTKLKQDIEGSTVKIVSQQQGAVNSYSTTDSICVKKSPMGSSIGKKWRL